MAEPTAVVDVTATIDSEDSWSDSDEGNLTFRVYYALPQYLRVYSSRVSPIFRFASLG